LILDFGEENNRQCLPEKLPRIKHQLLHVRQRLRQKQLPSPYYGSDHVGHWLPGDYPPGHCLQAQEEIITIETIHGSCHLPRPAEPRASAGSGAIMRMAFGKE